MAESKSKIESTRQLQGGREPRALSTEYHRARKQLMLWSAVLFIWELVGIDLEKLREAGGNPGAIVGAIKSPQAIPWALLILVVYFGFKLRIEWGQCNQTRRQVRESRMDYYSAFIVAIIAFALYFGQAISHVQFANVVQGSRRFDSIMAGVFSVLLVGTVAEVLWDWRFKKKRGKGLLLALMLPTFIFAVFLVAWSRSGGLNRWSLIGFLAVLLVFGAMALGIYLKNKRKKS